MEYNYKGIKPESIELLCLNRFNDSKPFYEEHKEELKQGITVPLRQMVLDMSDVLFDIDDKMYLDPVRVHSRIHRDTRGNRSKIKYRENMWVFFRRYKKEYPCAPFYYFEFYPNCYGYGLVFWTWKASDFRLVHQMIVEQPKRFRKALKACKDAGFTFEARDFYKKEVYPDAPKDLKPYLLAKNFSFTYNSFDMSRIASSTIIDEMKLAFDIARPMYEFMIEAHEKMMLEGLIKPEE
ncbi:DUF2461 domain-containing protein [Eubacterium coprostanoligenes]|uniref:DUF2461 domain-containing protein n=1 Tax=Eubacterium coprostanoligenes TaxID=290054 RepID=UPI002A812F2B|nr:DUF2461 domain-containing protein [Eubacterium coprostanoligenes]MDY4698709.1 DUF2461 domain-containing protein [Eubacterium coprostanoligenes]